MPGQLVGHPLGPQPPAGVEVEEAHLLVLEHRHRQVAAQRPPPLARHEVGASGGDRRVARAPARHPLATRQRAVGHRHLLVVARHRVPAVVAAAHQAVDLVVAEAAVLHRPQRAVVALGQALDVAVAVGEDVALALAARPRERVARPGLPGRPVQAQRLAAERGEPARVPAHGGVAGADDQRPVVGHQQPAAAVAPGGGGDAPQQRPAALGAGGALVELPRQHPHVVPAARPGGALAGVEAPVPLEVGVGDQPHQPGLARDPDLPRGEGQAPHVAVGAQQRERGPVALGHQVVAAADRCDVPRVVEAVGERGDPQCRHGAPLGRLSGFGRPTRCGGRREQGGGDGGDETQQQRSAHRPTVRRTAPAVVSPARPRAGPAAPRAG